MMLLTMQSKRLNTLKNKKDKSRSFLIKLKQQREILNLPKLRSSDLSMKSNLLMKKLNDLEQSLMTLTDKLKS